MRAGSRRQLMVCYALFWLLFVGFSRGRVMMRHIGRCQAAAVTLGGTGARPSRSSLALFWFRFAGSQFAWCGLFFPSQGLLIVCIGWQFGVHRVVLVWRPHVQLWDDLQLPHFSVSYNYLSNSYLFTQILENVSICTMRTKAAHVPLDVYVACFHLCVAFTCALGGKGQEE